MRSGSKNNEHTAAAESCLWRMDDAAGQGHIRRMSLDEGFSLTRSYCHACREMRFYHREPGIMATFIFMLHGSLRLRHDNGGRKRELRQGDVCAFLAKDNLMQRETPAHQKMEALVVKIDRDRLAAVCDDLDMAFPTELASSAVTQHRFSTGTSLLLERLRHGFSANRTGRLLAQARTIELLADLIGDDPVLADADRRRMRDLAHYLCRHLDRDFQLRELATMSGVNRTKLNRLFRREHGTTVFEFLRREKLRRAEDYLARTDMSITEIAYATGFSSSSHFSHVFHNATGCSPRDYRRQLTR
ncbi:AraC family transcriptional regulator [uncultured Desulfuromonas sp.]|uniref:AraC family transcriptional regulator n=1 Tax=uncultured Desulfuromonas sp. TaxID=181013 RepID=UPI002AAB4F9C|nr:AraC family transcriptional regulator [uncultured Desulfuromonas sp.]